VLWLNARGSRRQGTTFADLSGEGNHGTIYGATWANGPVGQFVLSFDGVDDYVDCGNDESVQLSGGIFTITFWLKLNSYSAGILAKASSLSGYTILITSVGKIRTIIWDGSTDYIRDSNSSLAFSEWNYITWSYDSVNDIGGIYINGGLDKALAPSEAYAVNTGSMLNISYSPYAEGWHLNGSIDEVRIYNRALSASESSKQFQSMRHWYGI